MRQFAIFAGLLASTAAAQSGYGSSNSSSSSLPIVDLGYQLHQASLYNASGQYLNFSNVRYAAPPVGALRWQPPQPPAVNRSVIQTGTANICPQANPAWGLIADEFLPLYLSGNQTVFNTSSFPSTSSNSSSSFPVQDPRSTEDCLSLDVVVPEKIFNARGSGYGAPVLVWIYGGGYTAGSKSDSGNPAGLLARSESDNADGVIYVSMNYRLGAFGWLSGPTFQSNGTANLGLYDQRFALEWVQQYIHLFGGDPTRVTVLGESAGGGSIMHQITAFGGNKGPAPFAQAVPQSPGFMPIVSANQQETIFNTFLSLLNVSTLEEARQLPYEALQVANVIQVGEAAYGGFVYGPVVDGVFAPALPGQLLLSGQYDKSLRVMVGHNADEGLLFTSPFVQNQSAFEEFVLADLPTVAALPATLSYIVNELYPPIFDGSQAQNYTNQIARTSAIVSELIFTCNTYYLDKAFSNATHSYLFAVFPAIHGQDIQYTYYTGAGQPQLSASAEGGGVTAPLIAIALQEYITAFAETGTPNEAGVPFFPIYGNNATVQVLNVTGISEAVDPAANARCDYWQKALYY